MRHKDRNLIIVAVIICLALAVLSPLIASSNPDGLERSAEQIGITEESGSYHAPLADYTVPIFGNGPYSGIVALIIGFLIVLGLGYVIALILKRRKPPEVSE
jgi:cobalt/nickel transport protein